MIPRPRRSGVGQCRSLKGWHAQTRIGAHERGCGRERTRPRRVLFYAWAHTLSAQARGRCQLLAHEAHLHARDFIRANA
eukprot:6188881-Pleurochrysis_carterae.AAC.1